MANMKHAKEVYKTLRDLLDSYDWTYDAKDNDFLINTSAMWDKVKVNLSMQIDAELEIIRIISHIDIDLNEDCCEAMAVAVTTINNDLIAGGFDYDDEDESLYYCLTSTFKDSLIGKGLLEYMLSTVGAMVEKYYDRLEAVVEDEMDDFEEIVKLMRGN